MLRRWWIVALSVATGVLTVSTLTLNATHSVSGLGFQPKAGIFWVSGRTETSDTNGRASHDWGAGVACTGVTQRALGTQSTDASANAQADAIGRDNCIIALLNHASGGGTDNGQLSLDTWDAGGFTVKNVTALSRALRLSYMVWGGSDITNVEVGTITEPGSTGNQTVTLSGAFQPDAIVLLSSRCTTINTAVADSNFCIGVATGSGATAQWVIATGSDDGTAACNSDFYTRHGEVIALHQATPPSTPGTTSLDGRASVGSISSTGFVLNWAERASTGLIFYLAIKGGRWAAGNTTLSNTGNGATNAVTGLAFQPTGLFLGFGGFDAESTSDTPQASQEGGLGAATSPTNRHVQWMFDDDTATTMVVGTGIATTAVIKYIDSGGTTNLNCDLTSFDSAGFTLDNQAALGLANAYISYLVMADAATTLAPMDDAGWYPTMPTPDNTIVSVWQ